MFHRHTAAPGRGEARSDAHTAAAPIASGWTRPVQLRTVWMICAIAVVVVAGVSAGLRKVRSGPNPVLAEAWGPLLGKNANPVVCISTAAQLTLIQRPVDPGGGPTVTSPDLLSWYQSLPGLPPSKEIYLGPSLTSPFWGDVAAAFAVSQVLNGAGITADFLPEAAI